ncbi:casein kinase I isoform delta [Suillus fuscotomentosus]|uniref:non-specific serine/threonine protein kinase n=1 Tax=Suillus fuscotomentosus TaxID=1912939 RepID=A0AAD4EA90_9AGAM|nr:casein kinase I isoform delta [Suillus fuscotomentosus]KAG1902466.1 casein kinase I isoform delta [Suillus fuscotomentosus]
MSPLFGWIHSVVYSVRNIINDDHIALKLKTIVNHSSSVEHEYYILKQLEGGVGIPHTFWFDRESVHHVLVLELLGLSLHQLFLTNNRRFSLLNVVNLGVQLLLHLEYIHSHNYVHRDIKLQNILVGLGNLRHTTYIIDFGITKTYWNTKTSDHVPFHHGVEPGRCDNLESLTYMLIYFLRGSLPWLASDDEKLSSSTILERKAHATIAEICHDIPVKFANILIYTRSLAFAEDPDYDHLRSLLHGLRLNSLSLQMLEIVYCNGSNASCVIVHCFQHGTIFPSTCCTDSH